MHFIYNMFKLIAECGDFDDSYESYIEVSPVFYIQVIQTPIYHKEDRFDVIFVGSYKIFFVMRSDNKDWINVPWEYQYKVLKRK